MSKESYAQIIDVVNSLQRDVEKFYDKEQNASGLRLRKGFKAILAIIKEEKANILTTRASRKSTN